MAANKDKITAQDIFDQGIKGSYEQFIRLNKEAAKSVMDLKREIIKMNNAMKKGGSTLSNRKAVTTATNKQAQATKKLTAETKKLTAAKKNLNTQSKAQNGVMGRLGGTMKNLLGAAGFVGLSYAIVNLTKSIYNNLKALESVDLVLSNVTKTTYELGQAQEFLIKTSDRLGLNLLKTSKRYATFLAAAQQSKLLMSETNDIFETFADIGANLALTSDEMGGIFLALEQMLSKGKVSTEELRRQLGERLPGAFGIMADALGVTTRELDTMLRKGEVMASEALPKFAAEAEKAFGTDKSKKVNTLAAAQERLANAWILTVDAIDGEDGSLTDSLKTVLGVMESILTKSVEIQDVIRYGWTKALQDFGAEKVEDLTFFESVIQNTVAFFAASIKAGQLVLQQTIPSLRPGGTFDQLKAEKEAAEYQEKRNVAFKEFIDFYYKYNAAVEAEPDTGFLKHATDKASLTDLQTYIEFFKKGLNEIRKAEDDAAAAAAANKEKLDKLRIRKDGTVPLIVEAIIGSPRDWNFRYLTTQIERLMNEEIAKLEKTAKELKEKIQLYPSDEDAKSELRAIEKTLKDFYSRLGAASTGFQPVTIRTPFSGDEPSGDGSDDDGRESFFTKKDDDTTGLQATAANINKTLGYVEEAYEYIADLENAQHERRIQQIEAETLAINEKYDTQRYLAEGDDELQKKIELRRQTDLKKQAAALKRANYEAAKAKKKQSLIDAAINTALAITSALTAPPPASWIGAGIAAALGLAQISAIQAQPLPAYAEGTDNHPGGFAMLGDGGKNELALMPDGSVYMSGDKPEIVDMPKGSQVMADAKDYINQQVIKAIIETDKKMDEVVVDKIAEAVHKGFKGVQINNHNNVNNSMDYQMWRNQRIYEG